MHGAGNDFVLFDNRRANLSPHAADLFRQICRFHTGIGADGVMLLDQSDAADFSIFYINADGSPGEMCGNGARCAVALAQEWGLAGKNCRFMMWDRQFRASETGNGMIAIHLPNYQTLAGEGELLSMLPNTVAGAAWLDTGVPHLVLEWQQELDLVDINRYGHYYCHHQRFAPSMTNVNFIKPGSDLSMIDIRTYERGVERETLACGTGAIAAAAYIRLKHHIEKPVTVCYRGGRLEVTFDDQNNEIRLSGPVAKVFEGTVDLREFLAES